MTDDKPDDITPPQAAGDKPPSEAPAEPLKGEVAAPAAAATPPKPAAAPGAPAAKPPAPAAAKPAAKAEPKMASPPLAPADPAPPPTATAPPFIAPLQTVLPGAVTLVSYWVGDWTVIVPVSRLLEVVKFLRDDSQSLFDYCSDVTASDWPLRPERFDVIYCLYSTRLRHRIRVKVRAAEDEPVPSVTGIWPAANWLEREVYDLFGVNFDGHPDRRRI